MMAYYLDVHDRISEHLVRINDEPAIKCKARKATTCVYSRKPIKVGDWVYRPFSNSSTRSVRWLASVVEEIEAMVAAKIVTARAKSEGRIA